MATLAGSNGAVTERQPQKVLKQGSAITRFVLMFPARTALVPVFERFFEMKLDGIDQLAGGALDHHLIAAEVGCRGQFETGRHLIELQAVVLPDAQDARFFCVILPDGRFRVVDLGKNRIVRFDDANQAVLILSDPIVAALTLLPAVERDDARAKAQTDHLMPATDAEHGSRRDANELPEVVEDLRVVIIEVAQSAA